MPYFAIHCLDMPGSAALRSATREAHLNYLGDRGEAIFVAGPLISPEGETIGSLIIVDVADRRGAYDFAAADPYSLAGLFQSVAITEWMRVIPG